MKRALIAIVAIAIGAFLAWQFLRPPETSPPSKTPSAVIPSKIENRNSKISAAPVEVSDLAKELNSPTTDIRADLRLVASILETFRTNFLQTGNPVGSNAEITAVLTGKNQLSLALIPANHPAINRAGDLCDRWGTPFFFHAESSTKMEIRSAGPDKKMWNEDDVILTP
ncbi:MAG: hypothetical protein ABIQ12_00860 [Opitutaceae bacterium]